MRYVAVLTIVFTLMSCVPECYEMAYDTYDDLRTRDKDLRIELAEGSKDFFSNWTKLDSSQISFLTKIGVPAYAQELGFGIPVEVTLAQSILESGWGKSELSKVHCNYFGIKAKKKGEQYVVMSTHEYVAGKKVTKNAKFRKYKDSQEAMADRTQWFLSNRRYKKVDFEKYDYKQFSDLLQTKGYATDPEYSKKLQRIIKMYNIDKYATWLRYNLPKYE